MADSYGTSLGGYVSLAGGGRIINAAAQTALLANYNLLLALIPDVANPPAQGTDSKPMPHPDFDKWPPELAVKMRKELLDMKAAWLLAPAA